MARNRRAYRRKQRRRGKLFGVLDATALTVKTVRDATSIVERLTARLNDLAMPETLESIIKWARRKSLAWHNPDSPPKPRGKNRRSNGLARKLARLAEYERYGTIVIPASYDAGRKCRLWRIAEYVRDRNLPRGGGWVVHKELLEGTIVQSTAVKTRAPLAWSTWRVVATEYGFSAELINRHNRHSPAISGGWRLKLGGFSDRTSGPVDLDS